MVLLILFKAGECWTQAATERGRFKVNVSFAGRRKAVRDRFALQGGTGDFPCWLLFPVDIHFAHQASALPRKDLLWAFPAVLNERPRNHPHTRRLLGDRARPSKALCRAVREAPGLTTAEGEFCKAAAPSHWGCSSSAGMLIEGSNNSIFL